MTSLLVNVRNTLIRLVLVVGVVIALGSLLGALMWPVVATANDAVVTVKEDIFTVPPLPEAEDPAQNSRILAADGSELAEIFFQEQRVIADLEDIPESMINAVIAVEDENFYEHNGINATAMIRAMARNISVGEIDQGASTITQQYIKNAFGLDDQTYERKIQEALWAIELEERLTKDEILERYLNRVTFGRGIYGVATAARYYFNKDVGDLTVAESALLTGLLRAPEENNPTRNPENAKQAQEFNLQRMVSAGYLTQQQADDAARIPISAMLDVQEAAEPEQPYFVRWITRLLTNEDVAEALGTHVDALEIMGETADERIASVFQGGLTIHTTLDPALQEMAEGAIAEFVSDPLTDPLGALVSVVPGDGAVVTMAVGPKTFGECDFSEPEAVDEQGRLLCSKSQVNPIVPGGGGSGRQPGSSFKPFVIAAALENGIPPGWQIDATGPQTIPGCDAGGADWKVNNSGGNGIRDMYSGVAGSSNVFHARLIKELGDPALVADMAKKLGVFASEPPAVCALALGSGEVYPLEMATAYATLANGGVFCAPYAITRIEDDQGRVLYEHEPECTRVIDEAIALRVVDIMRGPVSSGGTAPVANLGRWATRGKTGTTQDYRDAWFVGYVKQLATAAWIGYPNGVSNFDSIEAALAACGDGIDSRDSEGGEKDLLGNAEVGYSAACFETRLLEGVTINGRPYRRVFGGTIPAPMWKAYMSQAVADLEPEGFARPGPQPGAVVPNLVSAGSVAQAQARAERAKLNFKTQRVDDYREPGTFVGQSPAAGARVPAGNLVVLQVSNGRGEAPQVPNLVGLTQQQATTLLGERGYGVSIVTEQTGDPNRVGLVLQQSPGAGSPLVPQDGAVVIIKVGIAGGQPSPTPSQTASPSPTPSESPTPTPTPTPTDTGGGGGEGGGDGGGG